MIGSKQHSGTADVQRSADAHQNLGPATDNLIPQIKLNKEASRFAALRDGPQFSLASITVCMPPSHQA